jgi:hypothetical protein
VRVKTGFVRPEKIVSSDYVAMPIDEKDPIQRKYGAFQIAPIYRDPTTQLLSAKQLVGRFNPNKDIVWYFSPGMPDQYKAFFVKLADQTNNNVLQKAGGKGRLKFLNNDDATAYNDHQLKGDRDDNQPRLYGDPRYSFINWHSDLDNGSGLLGIAQFFSDPRTGETMSAAVNV